ncbi:hypothetical protein ASG90_16395 [Nocardioides sp. Soil797]|nr:hypothetical protein ASG90_16395 [Nocardioides sp. Soil797]
MSAATSSTRRIVLVEGASDRIALLAVAARDGRDLTAAGVEIVPMGGVTNTRAFALHYGPAGCDLTLAGLYDAPEEEFVRGGLTAAGIVTASESVVAESGQPDGDAPTPDDLAELGFFRCTRDLEDELIRAVGVDEVEAVIEANGEGRSLRLLAQMPAQAGGSREELLRRFMTSQSGRKARYAQLLVDAVPDGRVPSPLRDLLAWVCD